MQRTMLAAVQATDERLIAHRYLTRISAHLAFSSLAQKDDSHWGPSPECVGGVVTPLTPGVPQSPESDVQCMVKRCRAAESLLMSEVLYVSLVSQFWVAFLTLNEQYASHVPEHSSHHFVRWRHNLELDRSQRFFVFPLPWSLLSLWLIVMNPGLVTSYNSLQHRLPFCRFSRDVIIRMACCSGFSCFDTHRADTFLNLRWSQTILCTKTREMPVCWTMSEIDTRQSDHMKASTAAIVASVVSTTCRPRANFEHQTCITGLVKHLSP